MMAAGAVLLSGCESDNGREAADLLQIALVFNGDKAARQFTRYETVE